MSAHTAGPWIFTICLGTGDVFCGYEVEQFRPQGAYIYRGAVARVMSAENIDGITREEAHANARLIAAAPALLECCMNALGAYEALRLVGADRALPGMRDCETRLTTAIAKATGSAS